MEETVAQPRLHTIEEYLRLERDATEKHEYYFGEIVAMAGAAPEHALIAVNVAAAIHSRLKGKPCRAYSSDLRVRIPRKSMYVYPDLSVICGPVEYGTDDTSKQTIINPRLIVEVLSPSTESRDRVEKFKRYLQVKTIEEYVLVAQKEPRVETYFRQAGGTWLFAPHSGAEAVARLRSVEIDLPFTEVYAGVEFPPPPPEPETPQVL